MKYNKYILICAAGSWYHDGKLATIYNLRMHPFVPSNRSATVKLKFL